MATVTAISSTKPPAKSLHPSPLGRIGVVKHREDEDRKAVERDCYASRVAEAEAIRAALNDGKDKHIQVRMSGTNVHTLLFSDPPALRYPISGFIYCCFLDCLTGKALCLRL